MVFTPTIRASPRAIRADCHASGLLGDDPGRYHKLLNSLPLASGQAKQAKVHRPCIDFRMRHK